MGDERDIRVRLQSGSLNGDELDIHKLVGLDPVSGLFSYRVEATRLPGAAFDEDALLLQTAWLSFSTPDGEEVHAIYGMIWSVREHARPEVAEPVIELTLVPRAQSATMREMLDIFLEMTVPEIIEACLTRCGLAAGDHFDLEGLEESYLPKEFVVQYRETDFAFISRLCEHHGIFFFVDHSQGKDILTFGDRNTIFPTCDRTPNIPFRPYDTAGGERFDHIQSVHITRNPLPKRYTVRDYNYRIPGVDLMSSADVDPAGLGEIVEYGAHFKGPEEGQWFANVRAQELLAEQRVYTCLGNPVAICAGQKFMLVEHPSGDIELLVTAVEHTLGVDEGSHTTTMITAIPAEITFRPRRRTPKPRVNGIITGVIDAGVQDTYADVDDQGRYRVRFMFDTAGRGEGQASRLVRMAQPHAGEGFGMHFPLRPGTEVILSCIDGDPDRPIITGSVPNPSTVSPVSSANRDRNLIRTGGGNEIDISDEDGMHRIKMTTPHMGTVFQLGAENAAEVGAIISTHGNSVSQVADTVGTMAEVSSAISDIRGAVAGKSITSTAGLPNPIKGFEAVDKMAQSASKAVASLAKTVDTIANFGKNLHDSHETEVEDRKKAAEKAILALQPPQKYPDHARRALVGSPPVEVVETEDQFNKRIVEERIASGQAGAHNRSAYESAVADAAAGIEYPIPFMDGIPIDGSVGEAYKKSSAKAALDATSSVFGAIAKGTGAASSVMKAGKGAYTAGKKLFSLNHKAIQKATDAITKSAATATAAGGSKVARASLPRMTKGIRPPGAHYNMLTATDSVIGHGAQGFYGLSPGKSYIFGAAQAMVASAGVLSLLSASRAELAARSAAYVTSDKLVTILSRKDIELKSTKDTTAMVGQKLKIVSDDDTSMESKKKFFVKAETLLDVDGGDEAKLKAKKWSFKSTEGDVVAQVKADWKATIDGNMQWDVSKKSMLRANGGEIVAQFKNGGKFQANSGVARLEKQSGGARLTLKSSKAELDGKSSVEVKAGKIDIKGKVFLG